MTYLVDSEFGIKEFDTLDEVLQFLKHCVEYWCASNYDGLTRDELYDFCLATKDFGDIAQVYEINTPSLYLMKEECKIKRIY